MSTSLKKEDSYPLLVGLTGGIGSGKSTVAKIFGIMNIPVFDSDTVAKYILNNDNKVIDQMIDEFGSIYINGKLDRLKLSERVFKDKRALEKLNHIVHPQVKIYFEKWIEENINAPFLIKEAAILIESGAYQQLDKIIMVTAPLDLKIQRVMNRDNVSEDKVKQRMTAQLSDKEKLLYADYKIKNSEEELLIPQVFEIVNRIKKALK